jgi:carboxyl-terminal processing protease
MNRGQIKLTQAKFYRISGDSTQHQGVVPDIAFPSLYDKTKIGESALEEALPWDKIQPVPHVVYHDIEASLEQLEKRHKDRIKTDPDFIHLVKQIELIEEIRERKSLSLNKKTRINEKEKNKAQRLTLENERRKAKGMELLKDIDDLTKESDEIADKSDDDSSKDNDAKKDVKSDDKEKEADKEDDAMLKEASNILLDFIDVNSYKLTK